MGRLTQEKALLIVVAPEDSKGIGRICMRRIEDLTRKTLHGLIALECSPQPQFDPGVMSRNLPDDLWPTTAVGHSGKSITDPETSKRSFCSVDVHT